jgi:hypothetical protein
LRGDERFATNCKAASQSEPKFVPPNDLKYTDAMLRKAVVGASAILVLFHVWLLGGQAWAGELADPGRLLRWVVAVGLVAAILALRRQGASLFVGRKALVIWLLAALLHGPALADRIATPGVRALASVTTTLTQIALASAAALGLALLVGWRAARRQSDALLRTDFVVKAGSTVHACSPHALLTIAPRPPPRT